MNYAGKKVLVTGGTGFIGSFLVEDLLEKGAHVRAPLHSRNYRSLSTRRSEVEWMDGDLRDPEFCSALVEGIDIIFHLASYRRNVQFHHERCSDVLAGNVQMTLALTNAIRGRSDVKVIFFSTANIPDPISFIDLAQSGKIDGYVMGKLASELQWMALSRQQNFPLLILRPVGVYGPRDTFSDEGNVIPSLIVKADKAEKELTVWGSGNQQRAFLYVRDLVGATFALVEAQAEGIQFVSSHEVISVRDLATHIRNAVKPDLPIVFDTSKPEGRLSIPLLPLHSALQKFPWTTLEDGLVKTVEWWRKGES